MALQCANLTRLQAAPDRQDAAFLLARNGAGRRIPPHQLDELHRFDKLHPAEDCGRSAAPDRRQHLLRNSKDLLRPVFISSLIVLCGCSPQEKGDSPQQPFSFEQQVGMANVSGTEGCLAIANPSIKAETKITLADQPGEHFINEATPIVETATVVELLSKECDDNKMATNELGIVPTYYRIRIEKEWKGNIYAFAIIPPSGAVTTGGRAIEGDLDGDGTKEAFRVCSSSEGLHYQVWTGQPFTGQGRWHQYVYLGYDVDPSCTEQEYFGPK